MLLHASALIGVSVAAENRCELVDFKFQNYRIIPAQIEKEKIAMQETIEKDNFILLESCSLNLNEYSEDKKDWKLQDTINYLVYLKNSTVLSEILDSFNTNLGRLCYQFGDKLTIEQKKDLGLENENDLKNCGVLLLKDAAKTNLIAEELLEQFSEEKE